MKKLFYSFFAAAAMLFAATSCSQEELIENGASGNEVEVSFNVDLEGQQASRAIADGLTVDQLIFAVFGENNQEIRDLRQEDVVVSNKGAVVKTRLVKGQKYQFVFWAQKKDAGHYNTEDMKHIRLESTATVFNNDETRDAFYAHEPLYTVTGSFSKPVTLKRPFAQLNLATTKEDLEWAKTAGVVIDKSSVKVTGAVYSTLNTLSGYCADKVEGEFELSLNAIPDAATEKLTIKDSENQFDNDDYYYLSTSYLLVSPKEALTEEIEFTLTSGADDEVINTLTVTNAPLQRNWRTNIVGEILTGEGTFNIVIDPIFEADRNYPMDGSELDIWNGESTEPELVDGVYIIDQASDLAYIWQQEASKWNNAIFRLTKDLSFKNVEWDSRADVGDTTPATIEPLFGEGNGASSVTFYGDDHVIRDFIIDGQNKLNSLFGGMVGGSIHNLTIINATVKGMNDKDARAAIAVAQTFGTVTFENITIKDSYLEGTQKVGGLIGFVHENQVEVTNCTVDGLELIGLDNAEAGSNGGLIGCINKGGENKITNSYVKNSTFNLIQKSDEENEIAKRANGEFIGMIRGASTIVNITNCGVENNEYSNSIPWEPFHPQFVGGNYMEEATLIVNGSVYPEVVPDYIEYDTYWEVYTAKGLLKWAYRVNAGEKSLGLVLMNDITMPAFEIEEDPANETYVVTTTPIEVTDGVPSGSNWVPVCGGISVLSDSYSGHINGNDIVIRGLRVVANNDQVGFIGAMYDDASIKNLTIEDAVIKGNSETGAVVGRSQHGTVVENVHVKSSIINGKDNVGGIVGLNYRRHIKADGTVLNEGLAYVLNCTIDENSSVFGNGRVGGICGKNYGAVIMHCTNKADITGDTYVGGIVGRFRTYGNSASGFIVACNTTEDVTLKAKNYVGGITGYILRNDEHMDCASYIVACCSTSKLEGAYRGAIVGQTAEDADDPMASWALINGASQYKYSDRTVTTPESCRLVESVSDFSNEDIEAMNNAINEFNNKKQEGIQCSYQWSWTSGSWPVLVQK